MSLAYAQIHATTRALYSQMLSSQTWSTLAHTADFNGLLTELSKTVYGPYLELDRRLLTPRRVVYQIKHHLASVYTKLIRIAPKAAANVLRQLWRFYEVDNLKATLRGIEAGATWEQILFLLSPIPKHATLSLQDMTRMVYAGSVPRAIERLDHTPYYETLDHAVERYQAEHNLFPLEVALDLDYRRELWTSVQHLSEEDQVYAHRIIGTNLNIDNLLWALRYRVYHHLSEEEIINYTLPLGNQVTIADVRAIANNDQAEKIIARIFPEIASSIPNLGGNGTRNLRELELVLRRHVIKICQATFIGYPFHIGIPLAYLQLTEHEIRDLTTVIEAKASHMRPAAFMPLLEAYEPVQEPQNKVGQINEYRL